MSSFYLKWTKNHVHTLYCLRYGLWRMQLLFFILGYFLVFYSPSSPKNENFKKMKKHLKISSFNASAPKIMIMLYCFWDNGMWRMYLLFFILGYCLFTPPPPLPSPNSPKNEIFKKMKKSSGDIIILHECTKSHDHMLYWSWDMACDRCHCYFSFQAIFWPFIPLTAEKIKISKKWENSLEISSFYTSTKNYN